MAGTIRSILAHKGTHVVTLGESATVAEAVRLLARYGIGAIVVVDDAGEVVGLVAERDIVGAMDRCGAEVVRVTVAEIMSADVPTCTLEADIDRVAAVMTEGRHRHVPVVVAGELVGIVSVGDVVKVRMATLSDTAEQLRTYVAGSY